MTIFRSTNLDELHQELNISAAWDLGIYQLKILREISKTIHTHTHTHIYILQFLDKFIANLVHFRDKHYG